MPLLAPTLASAVLSITLGGGPRQATLLLGLNTDQSQFARESYGAMYDDRTPPGPVGRNVPLRTLVIFRDGDNVSVETLPFLAIPTARGFRYMTLATREKVNPRYRPNKPREAFADPEPYFRLSSTTTKPLLFDRLADVRAELARKPSLEQAIEVDFASPSWVTPRFFVAQGMSSLVHGGASAFNAEEKSYLGTCAAGLTVENNLLKPWLTAAEYRAAVVEAASAAYSRERWDPDEEELPWKGRIDELETVAFSLQHLDGRLQFVALVPLAGNASRSFNARRPLAAWPDRLAAALGLKQPDPRRVDLGGRSYSDHFLSPDGTTLIAIAAKTFDVLDFPSMRLLGSSPHPEGMRAVVMEEWALGQHAASWAGEMHRAGVTVGGLPASVNP